MKTQSLLLTALAASMVLVSCNKNETQTAPEVDTTPKSVTINLPNVIGTKGAGQQIENAAKVALTDLQVIFTDGNKLYKGKTAEGTDATHYFSAKTDFDNRADKVFHFLPAEVNRVIVVGNNGIELTATTYAELQKELLIEEQQNPADLDLYKEADLTTASGQDQFGHPLYKATVVLEPRVSRIEIGSFKYNATLEGTRKYKTIEVQQVMLNNYFTKADYQSGTASAAKNEIISASTVFGIFENAVKNPGWYSDVFEGAAPAEKLPLVTLAAEAYSHTYEAGNLRPFYHFFPKNEAIGGVSHPQVVVKLLGTDEAGNQVPLYLATNKFTPAVTTDFAKIYVMGFEFDDSNLANPQKCVDVTVDVMSWDVVPVTPEF